MHKKKLNIAVLFGGTSEEREVSIASGAQVVSALRALGHHVLAVDAERGVLSVQEESLFLKMSVNASPPFTQSSSIAPFARSDILRSPALAEVDIVFLALHGGTGEDGTIQGLLDLAQLPYTGSGHAGSAIAMDKDLAKRLFVAAGIATPKWIVLPIGVDTVNGHLDYPLIVKPNRQGSTLGLSLVRQPDQLSAAISLAKTYDQEVMLEEFIAGQEITVGVLRDKALAVGEIVIEPGDVFDYQAKYQPDIVKETFPANLPEHVTLAAQELALRAHHTLKLEGYSRADFRLDAKGTLWCLEVNTLPGMTATSLLPQSALACGIGFPELCERICQLGIYRHAQQYKR